jgi:hypothetical protein
VRAMAGLLIIACLAAWLPGPAWAQSVEEDSFVVEQSGEGGGNDGGKQLALGLLLVVAGVLVWLGWRAQSDDFTSADAPDNPSPATTLVAAIGPFETRAPDELAEEAPERFAARVGVRVAW